MKTITLTNSDKLALIDDEDYARVSQYKWAEHKGKGVRSTTVIGAYTVKLASFIMHNRRVMYDHRDRNWLNNQKQNLRECSAQQNACNRSKVSGKSSVYKGVSWSRVTRNWKAQIRFNGRLIYLGCYTTEVEAARAYNKAAIEFFKEFAALNDV